MYFSKSGVHISGLVSRTEESLFANSVPISKVNSDIDLSNAHITDMSSEYSGLPKVSEWLLQHKLQYKL